MLASSQPNCFGACGEATHNGRRKQFNLKLLVGRELGAGVKHQCSFKNVPWLNFHPVVPISIVSLLPNSPFLGLCGAPAVLTIACQRLWMSHMNLKYRCISALRYLWYINYFYWKYSATKMHVHFFGRWSGMDKNVVQASVKLEVLLP